MASTRTPPMFKSIRPETTVHHGRLSSSPLLFSACVPAASEYTSAGCRARRDTSSRALVSLAKNDGSYIFLGAPDLWESARFTSIFLASGFFCSQAESSLCRACRRIPTPNASPVTDHLKIRICRVPFKYILITQARTIQNPLDGNHNPDNKRKTVYGSNTHTSG